MSEQQRILAIQADDLSRIIRRAALSEALEAVRMKFIADSDCDDDDNYNCGIADAAATIDALIDKEASK